MRFPLSLTTTMVGYMARKKLARQKRFPLVLMLEPLHACNLTCTGCGRIREYSQSIKEKLTVQECLQSVDEAGAPIVSICGGEPLIYPEIGELVRGVLKRRKNIYLCTNGMFIKKRLHEFRPTSRFFFNVHLDGLEETHDLAVERKGVFKAAVEGIIAAKKAGFLVCTNTTVYKETAAQEINDMFEFFSSLEVDAHTISPGYEYDAAKKDMVKRLDKQPEDFFLTRKMTREKFAKIQEWGERFTLIGTSVYQEFLAGKREMTCTPWAIPTRNVRGWKAPCYLMTDGHYAGYQEMLTKVVWDKYGVVDGVARDPRCENCMVHCGYDPSGALSTNLRDTWINMKYNFSPKPKPYYEGRSVNAFNGVSIGKGHLAEAKAAINAKNGGACGTGDTTQRDELLAKIGKKSEA